MNSKQSRFIIWEQEYNQKLQLETGADISNMLAARDQENLVHGHQAAAAAKPLNQGSKQLAPKTPSNKPPKTPFKLPLNDENGVISFGGAKTAGKTLGKGNENLAVGGKPSGHAAKNVFVTPMGTINKLHDSCLYS